ncbi:hypothetical protein [Rhodococcus erythropolis]|uniref:hypothetical protein n=1 Tax=Rhodococcus erythropolis TaxID=1833 RepID=UPI0012D4C316|nr:hypothetical protein [Rhodococcus erythropolis]
MSNPNVACTITSPGRGFTPLEARRPGKSRAGAARLIGDIFVTFIPNFWILGVVCERR